MFPRNKKIKILTLYNYFTPAFKAGGPIQSIDTMVTALQNDLELSIFCSDHDLDQNPLQVQPDKWLKYKNAEVFYASKKFLKARRVLQLLKRTNPDTIFINGIYSWYFNIVPLLAKTSARKIVSVRGMLHPGALSQKAGKKKIYLWFWKLLGLHGRCEFHATTPREKKFIEEVFGKTGKIWVAPNFPRVLDYHPPPAKNASLSLISIALISPMKNHLLVLEALKQLTYPVKYLIYGPVKDDAYWKQCLQLMEEMPSLVNVEYRGEITPGKIAGALEQAHVFILPSKSENFGHALYEAMTAGKPVITSHFTPWANLEQNKAGINVSIEDATGLRSAVEFFATLPEDALHEWSKATREYALGSVDSVSLKQEYLQMFGNDSRNHS